MLAVSIVPVVFLILGSSALAIGDLFDEFDEFEVFIEINATDGDAGLQGKLDGDAWKLATVKGPWGPDGRAIFRFNPGGSLQKQGISEIQWESDEPEFGEFSLDEFLYRFPAGTYTAWGWTVEGAWLRSVTELTHDLPAGPLVTSPEENGEVQGGVDLVVEWEEVTKQFDPGDPQGSSTDDLESEIVAYIVVAEYDLVLNPDTDDEEEITRVLTIDVARDVFSAVIPADFLPDDPGEGNELEFKIEVGAVEESGNRTFWEVPLELVAPHS